MTVQLKEALTGLRHWWYVRRCSTETLKKKKSNTKIHHPHSLKENALQKNLILNGLYF